MFSLKSQKFSSEFSWKVHTTTKSLFWNFSRKSFGNFSRNSFWGVSNEFFLGFLQKFFLDSIWKILRFFKELLLKCCIYSARYFFTSLLWNFYKSFLYYSRRCLFWNCSRSSFWECFRAFSRSPPRIRPKNCFWIHSWIVCEISPRFSTWVFSKSLKNLQGFLMGAPLE